LKDLDIEVYDIIQRTTKLKKVTLPPQSKLVRFK